MIQFTTRSKQYFYNLFIFLCVLLTATGSQAQDRYSSVYTDDGICCGSGNSVYKDYAFTYGEFKLSTLGSEDSYYLNLSPTSIFLGIGILDEVDVSYFQGDGTFDGDERGDTFIDSVRLFDTYTTGVDLGWYDADGNGGYRGDKYLDVTSVVSSAAASGWEFLGFEISSTKTGSGILIRDLALTDYSSSPSASVPEVSATGIIAASASILSLLLVCFEYMRTRRRSLTLEDLDFGRFS